MVSLAGRLLDDSLQTLGLVRGFARAWFQLLWDWARGVPRQVTTPPPQNPRGGRVSPVWEDASFAIRSLRREPRFSALVVLVLGIGVGLNAATFAVTNAYLLRPLPFPEAERVVSVRGGNAVSWTEVDDWFEHAVSWDLDVFTLLGNERPHLAYGAWITPGFLDTYGVRPALGRTFLPEEVGRDSAPVVMISHALWTQFFGSDPDVIGSSVRAFTSDRPDHAELFTIVGVLPQDFWYLNEYTDVLAPIRSERALYAGRLHDGVSIEAAEAGLERLAASSSVTLPPGFEVSIRRLRDVHVSAIRPTLWAVQGAVALVLLVVCGNAAVLLLVRSSRRQREWGVRRALGGSRLRLGRQLAIEGMTLAGASGVLGLLVANSILASVAGALELRLGRSIPGGVDALALDLATLGASALACLAIGIGLGLVPVALFGGTSLARTLSGASRAVSTSASMRRAQGTMVALEIALSVTLLVGAGLLMRSALSLQTRDLGFEPEQVVRGAVGLRSASYPTPAERHRFFSSLVEQVTSLPDVEAVGLASSTVFETRFGPRPIDLEGRAGDGQTEAVTWWVDEGYLETMGAALLRGRAFSRDDDAGAEQVAIVSESFALSAWGTTDVVGERVRVGSFGQMEAEPSPWRRVVGVVRDIARGPTPSEFGDVLRPYRQTAPLWMNLVIRTQPGAGSPIPEVDHILAELDPEVPLSGITRLSASVDRGLAPSRFLAALFVAFSAFALALTLLGVYGVVSYAVRQRGRDIAIRMALGADRGAVTRMFVGRGFRLVGIGLGFGLFAALLLGRALTNQLYGVEAHDMATHATVILALALTSGIAIWFPARRAATTHPMRVLREE